MSKFKVGDRVRVVSNESNHCFEIGEEVDVILFNEHDNDYECKSLDNFKPTQTLVEEELELVNATNYLITTILTTILTEVSSRANKEYPELRSMLDQLVIAARIEALDEAISNINQIKQR